MHKRQITTEKGSQNDCALTFSRAPRLFKGRGGATEPKQGGKGKRRCYLWVLMPSSKITFVTFSSGIHQWQSPKKLILTARGKPNDPILTLGGGKTHHSDASTYEEPCASSSSSFFWESICPLQTCMAEFFQCYNLLLCSV